MVTDCSTVIYDSKVWACLSSALELHEQIILENFLPRFEECYFQQGNLSIIICYPFSVSHVLDIIGVCGGKLVLLLERPIQNSREQTLLQDAYKAIFQKMQRIGQDPFFKQTWEMRIQIFKANTLRDHLFFILKESTLDSPRASYI